MPRIHMTNRERDRMRNRPRHDVVADGRTSTGLAMRDGILLRAGRLKPAEAAPGAVDFAGRSLRELARESLQRAGLSVPEGLHGLTDLAMRGEGITSDTIALFERGEMTGGTTSDFPYILASTANKSLMNGFRAARTTYEQWCQVVGLNDFKAASAIRLSDSGDLLLVTEGGTYKATQLAERRESIQLATYARKLFLSRHAIINDDLGAFTTAPAIMGRRAKRKPNQLAVKVLLSNPAMAADSEELFASAHSNASASGDYALDTLAHATAGLANLVKLIRKQQIFIPTAEEETEYDNIEPRVWLVNGDNELIARQVINSAADPGSNNAGIENPFSDLTLRPVVEPSLQNPTYTGYSDTAHYLFADPDEAPVIQVGFLQGNREPFIQEVNETDADGRSLLVRLDCAAAVVDYQGAARETGVTS